MKYFVSAAQFPLKGDYDEGVDISEDAARQFLRGSDMISLLWHPDPAITQAIAEALGVATTDHCPYLDLRVGDEVLMVDFNPPYYFYDFSLEERQKLSPQWILSHCEFRLTTRLA
jgi:hypothetical protein